MVATLTQQGLVISWAEGDFRLYNTLMGVAAGAALLVLVDLGRRIRRGDTVPLEGYSLAFAVNGVLLTATGLHMTLTWPLAAGGFAYSNIIFGEPALVLGVVLLAAAWASWVRRDVVGRAAPGRDRAIAWLAGPMSVLSVGIGLGCFGVAAAGWRYTLFVAPPEEPVTGWFSQWPWLEASFVSGLYVLVGLGAVLLPLALRRLAGPWAVVVGVCWGLSGAAWLAFGAFNFFAHVGLIINTTTPAG
jgi:uncharacterized membrane protein